MQLSNKEETRHLNSVQACIFKKPSSVKCSIRMPLWLFFMFPRLDYDGKWNGLQDMTAEGGFLHYSRLQGCPKVSETAQSLHNAAYCYFAIEGTVTFQYTVHSEPTGKEVTGITGHLVKQFGSLQNVIYNAAILCARRDTFLCYLCNDNKQSVSEHHMPKMRQKFFATYRIEIHMNKSHFPYLSPSVRECHWNRSLLRQGYRMLYIMEMRETHSICLRALHLSSV